MDVILLHIEIHKLTTDPSRWPDQRQNAIERLRCEQSASKLKSDIRSDIKSITTVAEANGIYIPKIFSLYSSGAPTPNAHERIQIPIRSFDRSVYSVECAIVYLDGQIDYVHRGKDEMDYAEVLLMSSVHPYLRIDTYRPRPPPICKEHVCKLAAKYGFDTSNAMDFLERESIKDLYPLYDAPLVKWRPITTCMHCTKTYTESKWPRVCDDCIQKHGCGSHAPADISCKRCLRTLNNTWDNIRRATDESKREPSHGNI